MLTENEVNELTCIWLQSQGYEIKVKHLGTAKGDDIVAIKPGVRIRVECKGSKSPKSREDFAGHYMWQAASGAFFNAVRDIEADITGDMFAVALPNVESYRILLGNLQPFCIRNKVNVLWVDKSGVINVWQKEGKVAPVGFSLA